MIRIRTRGDDARSRRGGRTRGGAGGTARPPLPPRFRRRRRLLAWSAPVVLAFLLAGGVLLGTVLGNALGTRHYDGGRFADAADQYAAQEQPWSRLVEPWRAPFNVGTAHHRAGEAFLAVEALRAALVEVPEADPLPDAPEGTKDPRSPECRVRTNLSLAIEAMGDDAVAVGDDAMAAAHFAEAWEVLDPCAASQDNQDTSERQKSKEDSAEEEESGDPSEEPTEDPSEDPSEEPTPDPSDAPTPDPGEQPTPDPTQTPSPQPSAAPTPDEQQEELEERNREAERDRQEQQQREGGGFGGGQNW